MSRPSFCPGCGAVLTDETAAVGVLDDRTGNGGYDCYCGTCGWSADVLPDDEQGTHRGETVTATREQGAGRRTGWTGCRSPGACC
jgi:hypothetical protein